MARFFFIMALAMAFATSLAFATTSINEEQPTMAPSSDEVFSEDESSPVTGTSRFLAQYKPRATMTCDRFPRICRAKGSSGPDCCKKKCVNVMKDNLNCGQCGLRCRYGTTCCSGRCVNVMFDPQNCGGCKNRCKKGSFCSHGMCNYA
ncbi:stigma-specific STIG1-like protein 1 [Phoenix dactylifera]|uniref:Stigma-specific STIG1-like protein 1 n=1 Tax=Phoenix dactylifera TaxID=42345 RepID=A0A8B7BNR6_PHODC|nr:stigma-specific STIG1-like protein 1 [Phoenix dactylifera]